MNQALNINHYDSLLSSLPMLSSTLRECSIVLNSLFHFLDGNTFNAFEINSTGAIFSTIPLDFENDTQKTFDLTVEVVGTAGLSDTTQVRITVLDINDNYPKLINLPSPPELNISNNIPAGSLKCSLIC